MRLPHNAFRDWWLKPVLDRLDTIVENTARPAPQQLSGNIHVSTPDGTTAADISRAVSDRLKGGQRRAEATCGRDLGWDFEHRVGYYCDRALDHDGPHRALGQWFDDDGDEVDPPRSGAA